VSAGPWVSQFFPEYADLFKIYRQVLYWFDVENSYEQYQTENFPIFIWDFGNGEDIYGFPAIDGATGGIKIALEDYSISTTPEKVERTVSSEETMRMYDKFVKNYMNGVTEKCLKSISCLYTVTPDADFIIDTHPTKDRIILASPCSGHGFKHSSAVGEILAQLAIDGKTTIDISKFSLSRFK
jgi:sarcosine oxidase